MAKALIGHLDRSTQTSNARLRARVADLEATVLRLAEENDRLVAREAQRLAAAAELPQMQPV